MNVNFNLEFDDLLAFQEDVINNSRTHDIKAKYFKWITTIIILLGMLLLVKTSLLSAIFILIIAMIYFFLFPYLYKSMTFRKLKNKLQNNDYSHILGPCQMTFSENGIDRETKHSTSHFNWNQFEKVSEDNKHYFLYVTDLEGLIIPKQPDHMNEKEIMEYNNMIKNFIRNLK
ncbi:MAG TPA: YcxB family protein [Virgibacillus sp.]|nr:YcxB family protein [Virgibacillus sp.]HLR67937.1 YcxB family protein [Virgibacillus sp.]